MFCLTCRADLTTSNSRPQRRHNRTWRRRLCQACGAVFTSIESIDLSKALTVAYGGLQSADSKAAPAQPFDRDRLFISLHSSLRHRATAISDARALADTVIGHIVGSSADGQTDNRTIIQACLSTLRRFDRTAASHYAAFHPLKRID